MLCFLSLLLVPIQPAQEAYPGDAPDKSALTATERPQKPLALKLADNLELTRSQMCVCVCLYQGREREYLERTHTDTRRTCQLRTEKAQPLESTFTVLTAALPLQPGLLMLFSNDL